MGNSESQNIPNSLRNSPNFKFLSKLFEHYSTVKEGGKIVSKHDFYKLFMGENIQCADLLYKYFITRAEDQNAACQELQKFGFINGFDQLLKLENGSQNMVAVYFDIFSECQMELSKQDVLKLLFSVEALQTKKEFSFNETNASTKNLDAFANSLLCKRKDTTNRDYSVKEILQLLPRLFCGVHWWLLRSLSKLEGSNQINLHYQKCPRIQLISEACTLSNLLDDTALWILSVSIPPLYLKCEQDPSDSDLRHETHFNCHWKKLYDSSEHGLSHNRFKHHCFSYRGPTVTVVLLTNGLTLLLTLDVEWRESTKCFGGSNTRLYQINPEFKLLGENNLVLYNERTRGVPVGLTLGNNPSKPVVSLADGLTMARVNYSGKSEESVERMEVWGCAGLKAEVDQKQQQKWEKKQAEQLQKVKLPGTWDENPDKALLEMAGITTEHAQR